MPKAVRADPWRPPAGDLPGSLDSFVGRERELAELGELSDQCRLLTLFGPVGAGKSRLAVEFARRYTGFWDQVGFVDLSSVTAPESLAETIAAALRIPVRQGESLVDTITAALADGRALLVLDGCEHVVDACAQLVEVLLRRCPNVRILATSQELLRVSGEVTFTVGPMSLPGPGRPVAGSEMLRADAIALFVDRAREQVPGFRLSSTNGSAIADICARLDGMPLAIELAARWVRLLPLEELLARLDDRFALLTVAPRTATGRHRDLRAAIQSSVDLLESREQVVFRRLSVFAGGFDLAGATTICAGDDVPHSTVLKAISSLEIKSLVALAGDRRQCARFTLLESTRLYGLEQLTASGEQEAVHDRLAGWLVTLVESLPEQVFAYADTLRKLDEERDNLRWAAEWAAGCGDERHAPLAVAAARCRWERGDTVEARSLLKSVLDQTHTNPSYRSIALQQAAWLDCWQGQGSSALALAREAIGMERALERPSGLGEALGVLGLVRLARGELTAACSCLEESLQVVRPLGRLRQTARWLHNFAWVTLRAGDVSRAANLLEQVRPVVNAGTEPALQAAVLHTGGALDLVQDDVHSAETRFRESLRADEPNGYDTPRALEGLAITAMRAGRAERALHLVGAAMAIRRMRSEPDPAWRRSVRLATDEARRLLGADRAESTLAAGRRLLPEQAVAYALQDLASTPAPGEASDHDLTERECEVARLVADGMTNRQIAYRLRVSTRTVDAHLQHIRDKLGVRARAQVAVWAAQHVSHSSRSTLRAVDRPSPDSPSDNAIGSGTPTKPESATVFEAV